MHPFPYHRGSRGRISTRASSLHTTGEALNASTYTHVRTFPHHGRSRERIHIPPLPHDGGSCGRIHPRTYSLSLSLHLRGSHNAYTLVRPLPQPRVAATMLSYSHTCILFRLCRQLRRPSSRVAALIRSISLQEVITPMPPFQEGPVPRLPGNHCLTQRSYCLVHLHEGACPRLRRQPLLAIARLLVVTSPAGGMRTSPIHKRPFSALTSPRGGHVRASTLSGCKQRLASPLGARYTHASTGDCCEPPCASCLLKF